MNISKEFKQPSSVYRGKPFWAWNGKMNADEARRQLRIFKHMGLGGGFMHSRVGLGTPYLSDEWFDVIKACVAEARERNMEAWLYDEDRWPSGAAGGLVTENPKYRMHYLTLSVEDPKSVKLTGKELEVFLADIDGCAARNVRRANKKSIKNTNGNEKALVFTIEEETPSPWFNNQTYLDTLSQDAVATFIATTHDAYAREIGAEFSKCVPGVFTDEPNYGSHQFNNGKGRVSWTGVLPNIFKKRYGYTLNSVLPELFFVVDDRQFSTVRRDYYDCITHLFVNHFARQIFEWCEEHHLKFTGHVLCEETLSSQTHVVGSAMRFYEYMQAPGIDILCGEGLSRPGGAKPEYLTAKQCCSVLNQFGRTWMLSEIYGCTGWQFTLAEHKSVGDWQAALGVNLRCQHLAYYTMQGEAKRDYPASISYQSPWAQDYRLVEDYFARVNLLMTQGTAVRDVAVLHPIESAWGLFVPGDHTAANLLNSQLEEVQKILLEEHYDFDYVDEDILARHGGISKDMLRVAKQRYKAIVVPPVHTVRESTMRLLEKFSKAGGTVVFVQSDSVAIDTVTGVTVALERRAITAAVHTIPSVRRVSICTPDGTQYPPSLYMLRHDTRSGRWFVFICHTRQDIDSGELTIELPCAGQVQEWDAKTGDVYRVNAKRTRTSVKFTTSLPPYGSRLFVVSPETDRKLQPRPACREVSRTVLKRSAWPITRNEPNAFPLDRPAFKLKNGDWQDPEEILRVDRTARTALGLEPRGGMMVQPWARTEKAKGASLPVALRYTFKVDSLPAGPCQLVLETPARFSISLNGHTLDPDSENGWWIDTSFRTIPVAPWLLKQGINQLDLEIDYTADDGLEALYFTGDFGFEWRETTPVITALPHKLKCGNWAKQGFACYSGAISYCTLFTIKRKSGERVFIELPAWEGTLVKVRVNGQLAAALPWPPYEVDITDLLCDGENRLEIEIVSSRRNLLGPLHHTNLYPTWTGPSEFVTRGEQWTDSYMSVPYGLMKPPALSLRTLASILSVSSSHAEC